MSRAQRRMPALQAFPAAYWVGGDTGLKQTTKALWHNKFLNAAEVAAIVPIPQAVFDDQDYDMWAEIRPLLEEAIGEKLDSAIFFGDDVPAEWTDVNGIVPDAVTAGHEVVEGDNADFALDISQAMGYVEDDGFDVSGHAGPRRIQAKLRNLRAEAGEPATIYGERYAIFGNGAWDGTTLDVLGDYSQGIIGVRQDISFTVHTEGVISDDDGAVILNLMQQDSLALRVVARFGFVVANPITRQRPDYDDTERFPFAVVTGSGS